MLNAQSAQNVVKHMSIMVSTLVLAFPLYLQPSLVSMISQASKPSSYMLGSSLSRSAYSPYDI